MRAAEGLVRIVVLHVGAEVAGAGDAEDGVHVGAVEVDEAALRVDRVGDLAACSARRCRPCSGW